MIGLVHKAIRTLRYRRHCPLCGWSGRRFQATGIGKVARPDARCPICGSLERHRAAFLLLKDVLPSGQKVLHFAPERSVIPWLVSLSSEYLTADLYQPAMRAIDITDIDLPDASRTLVWCSHVLDDIPDDRKALSEMFRVLEPGGQLVLMAMIGGDQTLEDPAVQSRAQRAETYLYEDHVRLYGRDIRRRIESVGFDCQMLTTASLPADDQRRYGLAAPYFREVFLCRKPERTASEGSQN